MFDYRKAKPIFLGLKGLGFLRFELRTGSGRDYQKSKSSIDFCCSKIIFSNDFDLTKSEMESTTFQQFIHIF
jgi:hypothetical protein